MDYNEKLFDLFGGRLGLAEEEDLFFQLSVNDELRLRLKQMIAVEMAVQENAVDFAPPVSASAELFSKLGYTYPMASLSSGKSGFSDGMKNFYHRYSQGIISALISSAATVALMLALLLPGISDNPPGSLAHLSASSGAGDESSGKANRLSKEFEAKKGMPAAQNSKKKDNSSSDKKSVQFNSNKESSNINSTKNTDNNIPDNNSGNGNNSLSSLNDTTNITINKDLAATNQLLAENGTDEITPIATPNKIQISEKLLPPVPLQINSNQKNNIMLPEKWNLSAELRGMTFWSFEEPTINPAKDIKFNNLSLLMLYSFDERFSLGAELRQENYFLRFNGTGEGGRPRIYEEQPNFTSLSIAGRYVYKSSGNINPMAQISVGLTSIGGIGRAMLGLQYAPYNEIRFLLGAEFGYLGYTFDNNWYSSQKIGLVYGISFNF